MATPRTAPELARVIADVLEAEGLPYAIGGALALGFYAPPRATVDVDVNVFVPPSQGFDRTLSALAKTGFVPEGDLAALRNQACSEGQFRGRLDGMRVDVFVPAIDFYARLADRRREVSLLGRPIWILGVEDLVVLKLMFYRRKDLPHAGTVEGHRAAPRPPIREANVARPGSRVVLIAGFPGTEHGATNLLHVATI